MAKSKLSSHLTKQIWSECIRFKLGEDRQKNLTSLTPTTAAPFSRTVALCHCTDHEIASLFKIPVNETHGMDGLMAYEYIKETGTYESNSY